MKKGNRCKWELFCDILNATARVDAITKTKLMHEVYMDWNHYNRYMDLLVSRGFIRPLGLQGDVQPPRKGEYYMITPKGVELWSYLTKVEEMLK